MTMIAAQSIQILVLCSWRSCFYTSGVGSTKSQKRLEYCSKLVEEFFFPALILFLPVCVGSQNYHIHHRRRATGGGRRGGSIFLLCFFFLLLLLLVYFIFSNRNIIVCV
jgi:hypothetical protein